MRWRQSGRHEEKHTMMRTMMRKTMRTMMMVMAGGCGRRMRRRRKWEFGRVRLMDERKGRIREKGELEGWMKGKEEEKEKRGRC